MLINNRLAFNFSNLIQVSLSGVFSDKSPPDNPSRDKILENFNVNTVGTVVTTARFYPLLKQAASLERPSKIVNM
jgi:hypothetical protein